MQSHKPLRCAYKQSIPHCGPFIFVSSFLPNTGFILSKSVSSAIRVLVECRLLSCRPLLWAQEELFLGGRSAREVSGYRDCCISVKSAEHRAKKGWMIIDSCREDLVWPVILLLVGSPILHVI